MLIREMTNEELNYAVAKEVVKLKSMEMRYCIYWRDTGNWSEFQKSMEFEDDDKEMNNLKKRSDEEMIKNGKLIKKLCYLKYSEMFDHEYWELVPNYVERIGDVYDVISKSKGNFTLRRFWNLDVDDPENYPMEWDCDIRFGDWLGHSVSCCLTPEKAVCEAALDSVRNEQIKQ